jgi:DNA-binding transcriptional regulator YiaG
MERDQTVSKGGRIKHKPVYQEENARAGLTPAFLSQFVRRTSPAPRRNTYQVMNVIRNRLKFWREQLGIKRQYEFACMLMINQHHLNRWEQQKSQPSLETLCKLREKLKRYFPDITLDDLIEYDP